MKEVNGFRTSIFIVLFLVSANAFSYEQDREEITMFSAAGFEIGAGFGVDLGSGTERMSRSFGIAFRLADNVQFGFQGTLTDDSDDLQRYGGMRGELFINPNLSLALLVGSFLSDDPDVNPALATGIGLRYAIARTKGHEALSTGVSIGLDYLTNPGLSVDSGTLLIGMIFSLGI